MINLFGIKNCDTVKKARKWLEQHHIEYRFHDFRADGLNPGQVQSWLDELGAETLVNKRGTTWKQLDDATRAQLDSAQAAQLIAAHPALIKRPLLDIGHQRHVGFNEALYGEIFKNHTL